jgi:hypothetical protein
MAVSKKPAGEEAQAAGVVADGAPEPVHAVVMGVEFDVSADALDNLELLDLMAEVEEGNIFKLPALMRTLFGKDWSSIHESLRDERGVVTATRAAEFFSAAMQAVGAKNS